jgi:hypothetical protein
MIGKKIIGGRLPKSSTKHQPERGGLQRPDRAVTSVGYHIYRWDWAQTQVNPSLDATSTLALTTLII